MITLNKKQIISWSFMLSMILSPTVSFSPVLTLTVEKRVKAQIEQMTFEEQVQAQIEQIKQAHEQIQQIKIKKEQLQEAKEKLQLISNKKEEREKLQPTDIESITFTHLRNIQRANNFQVACKETELKIAHLDRELTQMVLAQYRRMEGLRIRMRKIEGAQRNKMHVMMDQDRRADLRSRMQAIEVAQQELNPYMHTIIFGADVS